MTLDEAMRKAKSCAKALGLSRNFEKQYAHELMRADSKLRRKLEKGGLEAEEAPELGEADMDEALQRAAEFQEQLDLAMEASEVKAARLMDAGDAILDIESNSVDDVYAFYNNHFQANTGGYAPDRNIEQMFHGSVGLAFQKTGLRKWMPSRLGLEVGGADRLVHALFGDYDRFKDPDLGDFVDGWAMYAASIPPRYNAAAGGEIISMRGNWRLPQEHNVESMLIMGVDKWAELIRDKVVWSHNRHKLSDAELRELFRSITEQHVKTEMDFTHLVDMHRQLDFTGPNEWLEYHKSMGADSTYSILVNYIQTMERLISMTEMFGVEPLKLVGAIERKFGANPSFLGLKGSQLLRAQMRVATGASDKVVLPADAIADGKLRKWSWAYFERQIWEPVRGVVIRAALNSAVFSLPVETVQGAIRAGFWDMPAVKLMQGYGRSFYATRGGNAEMAAAMGFYTETMLHRSQNLSRILAADRDFGITSRLSSAQLELTGFTAGTDNMKSAFVYTLLQHITRKLEGSGWSDLPSPMKKTLGTYGFGEDSWSHLRAMYNDQRMSHTQQWGGAEFRSLNPSMLEDDMARRVIGMILSEANFVSGNQTIRSKALLTRGASRGTLARFALDNSLVFMNWALQTTMGQIWPHFRNIYGTRDNTVPAHIQAIGGFILFAMVAGHFSGMMRDLIKGREIKAPSNGKEAFDALITAASYGNVMGIATDLLAIPPGAARGFSPISRQFDSPVWAAAGAVADAPKDLLYYALDEEKRRSDRYGGVRNTMDSMAGTWWLKYIINNVDVPSRIISNSSVDIR